MSNITLTEADKGKTIAVQQGTEVLIRLNENPTTGYRWAIDQSDDAVLPLQSSNFASTPGAAVGAGGARTIHVHRETARNCPSSIKAMA